MRPAFDSPWLLALLPLALLPWLAARRGPALALGWLAVAPRDAASQRLGVALQALASLAIAAVVLALAGPHLPEYRVERIGQGAEIVLLLDRSRSMDQGFAAARPPLPAHIRPNSPEAIDFWFSRAPARMKDPKGKVAREVLMEFVHARPNDRYALVAFSTLPIRILDFTDRREAIEAAVEAGNVGRGLGETNIGAALDAAIGMFDERPYTGSRLVLLVSDGGDRLDPSMREQLERRLQKARIGLVWLYLRSANSPELADAERDEAAAASVPELVLHKFFGSLRTPYRAYEVGDGEQLKQAVAEVGRAQRQPLVMLDLVPRRDLAPWALALALACTLPLALARLMEIRRWT